MFVVFWILKKQIKAVSATDVDNLEKKVFIFIIDTILIFHSNEPKWYAYNSPVYISLKVKINSDVHTLRCTCNQHPLVIMAINNNNDSLTRRNDN